MNQSKKHKKISKLKFTLKKDFYQQKIIINYILNNKI